MERREVDFFKYTDEKTGSTALFDYWFISIEPKFKRLRYGFELKTIQTLLFMQSEDFSTTPNDDVGNFFCFPFLHANDVFKAPSWIKDTVWYQIFPERFANGDCTLNPKTPFLGAALSQLQLIFRWRFCWYYSKP